MKRSTKRFLSVMGSILDIYPNVELPAVKSGMLQDANSLHADVVIISSDFRKVINEYESASGKSLPRTWATTTARQS